MLEPEARAQLVSLTELPKLVDAAVGNASKKLGANDLVQGPVIKRWEIIGKVAKDLTVANRFATEIAAQVTRGGTRVEPAVLQIGKHIVCGFIEPPSIPLERKF